MNTITAEQFSELLEKAQIKPRIKRELRFVASTSEMTDDDWRETELLSVQDRSGNKGVLLIDANAGIYVLPYEMRRGLSSSLHGRAQPIICDFCRTWQSGGRAGSITIPLARESQRSITYLCCADLKCSQHVRTKTSASHTSRSQLREDMTDQQRIERLTTRLREIILRLPYMPVQHSAEQDDTIDV